MNGGGSGNAELRKHGSMGNEFPEPMTVFWNQVIRQGCNIQESVKLLSNNSKKDFIYILKMSNLCILT